MQGSFSVNLIQMLFIFLLAKKPNNEKQKTLNSY